MMKLIADSSANLTMLEGVTYQSVPMTIRAGKRDFVDDETLDTHELLDYLAAYNGKSGTACPSLDGWLKAFEGADEIFVITSQAACPAPVPRPWPRATCISSRILRSKFTSLTR